MTTIAHSPGLIAYDSREMGDGIVWDDDCNKRRTVDEVEFFFSGRETDEDKLIQAYLSGEVPENLDKIDCQAIVVDGDKVLTVILSKSDGFVIQKERPDNCFSLGSGSSFALAAMDLGLDAKEAVQAAAKRDPNTGGRIRTFKIK